MVSLVFVLCELGIQVLQLISCSQNMTSAFVKNAIHARVLTRKFTRYFVTRKCEKKKSFFLTEKTLLWVSANHFDIFKKKLTVSFFASFYL